MIPSNAPPPPPDDLTVEEPAPAAAAPPAPSPASPAEAEATPVISGGEAMALWKEEHLCTRCNLALICKHAVVQGEPLFITISSCRAFTR